MISHQVALILFALVAVATADSYGTAYKTDYAVSLIKINCINIQVHLYHY